MSDDGAAQVGASEPDTKDHELVHSHDPAGSGDSVLLLLLLALLRGRGA